MGQGRLTEAVVAVPDSYSGPDLREHSGPDLREQLAGWVARGLIDAADAARIEAAAAAGPAEPAGGPPLAGDSGLAAPASGATPRRLPMVVEALGYLGAVVAVVAGFTAVRQLWPAIPAGAELAFAGTAAAALLLAGIMLRAHDHPAFGRLRSALWLASAVSFAGFAGLITGPGFLPLGPASRLLVTEAAVTAYALVLWWRSRVTLQHLAVFAGTAALGGTGLAQAWPGPAWRPGLGLWVLSLLWGIAVHRGFLAPRTAGYAAAGIGLLAGAQLAMDLPAGQALAVATVAGLLAAGVALRRVLLLGLGAVGAIVILPQAATRYVPGGAGAAASVFAVGLVMLGVALWLAKARTKA
jgi:hypothetical protein